MSGQLPNAPFGWTIDRACEVGNMYTLPDTLRFKLVIQRYCHRLTTAMRSISYDPISVQPPLPGELQSFIITWRNDIAVLEMNWIVWNETTNINFRMSF